MSDLASLALGMAAAFGLLALYVLRLSVGARRARRRLEDAPSTSSS